MKIGIIGGGAAGMTAAVAAARAGADVVILEKNDRIGKKILVTGNGKCNLSNLSFSASCYHSKETEKAWRIASRFTPQDTIRFFEEMGLCIKDKNGYLYPACEQASAVLDVLRYEIASLPVKVFCGETAERIYVLDKNQGFEVFCKESGKKYLFDQLIVTSGGQASPKTGSDGDGYRMLKEIGLSVVRPVPALVQLRCAGNHFKALSGIRCEAKLALFIDGKKRAEEAGELQMTDYGISGIPVFQLSRHAAYALAAKKRTEVVIDLFPQISKRQLKDWFTARKKQLAGRTAEEFLTGTIHKKWVLYFLKEYGIRPQDSAETVPDANWLSLLEAVKEFTVHVTDTNSFQNAQVCAGGVSLNETDENLESVRYPGLYIAGELLDVDGRCGGYNLQWAWGSGYLAGKAAAEGGGRKR